MKNFFALVRLGLRRPSFVAVFAAGTAWSAWSADPVRPKVAPPPPLSPAAKAAETSFAAVEKATSLRAAGKLDDALQVLRDANRDIKTAEGEESAGLIPVNNLAAEILIDQGQLEPANTVAEKTLAIHEALIKAKKVSPESLGVTLLTSARIQANKKSKDILAAIQKSAVAVPLLVTLEGPRGKNVARACDFLEESVESLEEMLGPTDSLTSDNRKKAADVFEAIGRFDQAIAQRKAIFRCASARAAPAEIEDAADRLGRLMAMTGRANEASAILVSAPAPSAARLRLLGDLRLAANELLSADAAFEAATNAPAGAGKPLAAAADGDRLNRLLVSIRRGRVKSLPEWFEPKWMALSKAGGDPATIASLVASSAAFASLGDSAGAIKPLTGALALLKKQKIDPTKVRGGPTANPATPAKPAPPGPPNPAAKPVPPIPPTAAPPANPGAKPAPGKAPAAAAIVARPIFPPAKAAPQGLTTPLMAEVAGRLAGAYFASGNYSAALLTAQPELGPAESSLGPGDGRLSLLRVIAAGAAIGQGEKENEMAATLAAEAIAYGLARPDDAWEEILTASYDRLAASDTTTDWRNEFVAARVRQFGESHPHVASAWGFFGSARLAAADWPAAVMFFTKSRDLYQAALGEDHPDVAASTALLAHALRVGGDPAEAATTAADAVAILEKRVGRNHPATLEAIDVLVAARLQAGVKDGVAELLERLCAAETMQDPVRRAYHLARLAEVTAWKDKASARLRLQSVMALPCWTDDKGLRPVQRRQLADTAAYVARAYRLIGDDGAAETTLNRARSIALRIDASGSLLERIERLATPEP